MGVFQGIHIEPYQERYFELRISLISDVFLIFIKFSLRYLYKTMYLTVFGIKDVRTKIQPAAGHGRSSTKVVLPENENPAGRPRRPFQY